MCIFCEIIKGNIPCYKLYEDDHCLAFLDISQASIGHTLIVPKEHFENIFELPEYISEHIGLITNKLAKHLKSSLNLAAMNVLNNNGELAGQTVGHYHVHLIPRYNENDIKIEFSNTTLSKEEFNTLLKKLEYK